MAFTYSSVVKSVFGNLRVAVGKVTADAVSGSVAIPGMSVVLAASYSPISMTTNGSGTATRCNINVLEAATAANGYVAFSGCVNADTFFVTVYGR